MGEKGQARLESQCSGDYLGRDQNLRYFSLMGHRIYLFSLATIKPENAFAYVYLLDKKVKIENDTKFF